MNLNKQEVYHPTALQFELRPRKVHVDAKKEENEIIVGKKASLKIFESKHNLKPLQTVYKFQIGEQNECDRVNSRRSLMNRMHLVPNPQELRDDLEVKKATLLTAKNQTIPMKNEFIDSKDLIGGKQLSSEQLLEKQFKNERLHREFVDFMNWQKQNHTLGSSFIGGIGSKDSFGCHSNIVSQDQIMQIGKCLILTHHNSPQILKNMNTVTLGRPGADFLRVTRYRDQIYFEDKLQADKQNNSSIESNQYSESHNSTMRGSQTLKFSRLSKGLITQYKPELKCVYPLKIMSNKSKRLDVNIKKMNRTKVKYLNQMGNKFFNSSMHPENANKDTQVQQLDLGFEDLQNGIYVTAFPQ